MNASSSKTLVIGLGGLGLLFVVAAANRHKKAQEVTDSDPELTPPGPPTPIGPLPSLPSEATPAVVLDPPGLDVPSTSIPVTNPAPVLQAPSLDPYVEPPGPPMPSDMSAVTLPPASPSSGSMPIYPVTVPASAATASKKATPAKQLATKQLPTKRPFGNDPLDVNASAANVSPHGNSAAAAPAAKRSPAQAAADLLAYVTPILAAKRGSELGLKNKPNAVVKAAQLDMNDLPADGIYGPRTSAPRGRRSQGRSSRRV
jgi:hypothetical protein